MEAANQFRRKPAQAIRGRNEPHLTVTDTLNRAVSIAHILSTLAHQFILHRGWIIIYDWLIVLTANAVYRVGLGGARNAQSECANDLMVIDPRHKLANEFSSRTGRISLTASELALNFIDS